MKKRVAILTAICTTALVAGGVSFINLYNNQYSKAEAVTGTFVPTSELPESYVLNSEFTVPKGKISYDGHEYSYNDYYLKYPNGRSYKKDSYVLDVSGRYECIFIYTSNTLELSANYVFSAYSEAYTINDSRSSVKYESQIKTNIDPADGLHVVLAENDMFTYNQVIDISNADRDTPIIKYHPYAYSLRGNDANDSFNMYKGVIYDYDKSKPRPNSCDSNCSVVRVTDAYDSSIYFETFIYFRTANLSNNRQQQYVVCGATNQEKVGIERATTKGTGNRLVTIDGVSYREYIGLSSSSFGATINTTTGYIYENRLMSDGSYSRRAVGTTFDTSTTADISNADDYGYSIYYEAATKKVYIRHVNQFFINDLDEVALHGQNVFPGFTTGEVYVSIYGLEYKENVATYDIESIYGISDLSANTVKDNKAPIINLNNDNNNFNIAVNEEFHLFDADVIDCNYNGNLKTFVYYEYGTTQESQVNVTNNTFTPLIPGKYTIVYRATDSFGNYTDKTVDLYAITTSSNKSIDFSVEKVNEVDAGKEITLPTPNITVYNNEPIINCYALFEDGERTNINTTTWKFLPKKVGTYQINYEYSDGISSYSYQYNLNSKPSNNIYLEEFSLPKYIIKDAEYTLDETRIVKVSSRELSYDYPEVYVNEDGAGFNRKIDYKDFSTTASNTVQFQYKYNGTAIFTSEVIKVKDVDFKNKLNKSLYFDNNNINVSSTSSSIILASNVDNSSSNFINPLNFSTFSISFDLAGSDLSNGRLDIILTDYEDDNNTFKISLFTKSDKKLICVSVNDDVEFSVAKSSYTISYDALREMLKDSFENETFVKNPFNSDRFYLSFKYTKLTGESNIAITGINGQVMNEGFYDTKDPNLNMPSIENRHSLGSIIDLSFFYPDDTLSPYLEKNYTISVMYYENDDAEGVEVRSIDGTLLDGNQDVHKNYSFKLEKVGIYEVDYTYKDQTYFGGRYSPHTFFGMKVVYSVDNLAPTISLNNGYNEYTVVNSSLGASHTIMGYQVSDNVDQNVNVTIYVMTPGLNLVRLEGNSFNLNDRGDYRVYYYAKDSAGNISSTFYTVRVK